MGNYCSCFNEPDTLNKALSPSESQNVDDAQKDALRIITTPRGTFQRSLSNSNNYTYDIHQITMIQSLLRGFNERRKAKRRLIKDSLDSHELRKSRSLARVSTTERKPSIHTIIELSSEKVPNYSSKAVESLRASLGPFEYSSIQRDGLTTHGPVLVEGESVYIGDWGPENKRHGCGIQINPDGSVYEGHWQDDKPSGQGRYISSNCEYYEGGWLNGFFSGFGKFVEKNNTSYEGLWEEGKKHGQGAELLKNGTSYTGNFDNNCKCGTGKLKFPDGSYYEGEFVDGEYHGDGLMVWNDGKEYLGGWDKGKMHGKGVFKWNDGRKYTGEYYEDKKHGFGEFIWADGRVYEGEWKDDKQHGTGSYTTSIGTKKGVWKNGKRVNE